MKKTVAIILLTLLSLSVFGQGGKIIKGQILDDSGLPLPGAVVMVAGTAVGTTADSEGKYSIKALDDDVLIFSSLGFIEIRERVDKRRLINVVMKTDAIVLNEAVTVGYGTMSKSDLTGAVSVVDMDKISNPAVTSVDQALQGRVAGVDVINSGGEPGAGTSIRIRGSRSISASNDPLIVVDGVMDAVSSFSDINPADIKSVTVLKDASSTAIYGSRGSNGVILVTTKGESAGKLSIVLSAKATVSSLPKKLDVMNAAEFAQLRDDFRFIKGTASSTDPLNKTYYSYGDPASYGEGTDWQDALTRTSVSQSYYLAISQGDSKQHSYFSIGYDDNRGIVIGSDMNKFTGVLKIDRKLFKWLKAGARVSYSYRHNNLNKVSINGLNNSSAVCLSPLTSIDDIWNRYADESGAGSVFNNPYLKATKETNYKNTSNLRLTPWLDFSIIKGLDLNMSFTYTDTGINSFYYSPASMPVATYRKTGGTATRYYTIKHNLLSENTLTWKKTVKKQHKIDAMLGFTAQKSKTDYKYTSGRGYMDDNVGPYNMEAIMDKRNYKEESSISEIVRMSILGRANYSYAKRYFVTFTGRYDGSSNFSTGNKWAFFPAAALKWDISNEKWMSYAKSQGLSGLALRLGAGRSGNDAVGSYVSQAVLDGGSTNWVFGDTQLLYYAPKRFDNPDLTWEKTDSFNAGLDISVLKDRITMSLDGYMSKTSDLLLTVQNAAHSGYSSRYANIGSTKGYGVELTVSSRNISTRNFVWTTDFSISHNASIITDIGADLEYVSTYSYGSQMLYGYKKGYPANALWGYQFAGVWHNTDEIAENEYTKMYGTYSKQCGFSKYVDVNHDGVLNSEDFVYLGSSDPDFYGGLSNTFKYKNFEFGFFLTYSVGGYIYNLSEIYLGSGSTASNKYRYMIDCWHPARNPQSDIPSPYSQDYMASSRYVHDASYLRLKSANISYTLNLDRKVKWLRDITFSLYGDNLLLFTKYNGFDPDVSSSNSVRRLDNDAYPTPRSFVFSIKFRY